ncbi:MAG: hypothetical protein ABEJ72_09900, partial [Candidatus Aenigmatarchaeota archaeon]
MRVITEDPRVEAFTNYTATDVGRDSTVDDLRFHTNFTQVGPWKGVGWLYAPGEMVKDRNEGLLLL